MTTKQTNKLRMLMALRILLKASPKVMAKMPNSEKFFTELDAVILSIQANNAQQQVSDDTLIEQRNKLHDNLVELTLEVQGKMRPYAAFQKNESLLKFLNFTKTDLNAMADVNFAEFCKSTYNKVNEHKDEIEPYGLNAQTQTAYLTEINKYELIVPQVKVEKQAQHNIIVLLGENFDTADEVVDNFDMLVEIVRTSDAQFYADYKAIRKIDASYSPSKLVGHVFDAETGAGVPNATVTLTLNDSTKDPIVKLSADKGGFQLRTITPGYYTVTMTKIGYETQTFTITVMGDNPYNLDIKAVKTPNK